jgi:hypothetical protein
LSLLIVFISASAGALVWHIQQTDSGAWARFLYGGDNPRLAQTYFDILIEKNGLQKSDFTGPSIFKQDNGIYTYTWRNDTSKTLVFIAPNADEACYSGSPDTKGPSCVTTEDWHSYQSKHR